MIEYQHKHLKANLRGCLRAHVSVLKGLEFFAFPDLGLIAWLSFQTFKCMVIAGNCNKVLRIFFKKNEGILYILDTFHD